MGRLVVSSFAGGLWLPEGREFGIPPDALLIADNVEYLTSSGVIGRRGREQFGGNLGSGNVRALWRHYPRSGTKNTLAFVGDGATDTLWRQDDDTASWTSVTTVTDADTWGFANWQEKNKTFIVNNLGGLKQWNGTALSSVTASGDNEVDLTKLGPFITLHKNRLFATHIDELNYSVYASNINDETTWLSDSHLALNYPQGGSNAGLMAFNDFLILLRQDALFRFVGDISTTLEAQLTPYTDRGCTAPNTVSMSPWGIIYLGKNGLYITEGTSPNPPELSIPIKSLFVSRSGAPASYPSAIGRWYQNKQQYVLKLDPADQDAYVLQRVEVLDNNEYVDSRSRIAWIWWHHTNLPCTAMATWDSESDDGRLLVGDENGYVHIFDRGEDDNGLAIEATLQTASIPIDNKVSRNPENGARFRSGRINKIHTLHRASTTISGEILFDQAAPGAGAAFTTGGSTLREKFTKNVVPDQTLWGRFVSFWYRNTASSADFEIHAIDARTILWKPRVWRDDNDELASAIVEARGHVTISNNNTEATVTFAVAQPDTDYEVAFGLYPSSVDIGPTTPGIKPGTKSTTGFTAEVGGAPGSGYSYLVMWILSRAS